MCLWRQWREASYTRSGGDVVRVYTVCNVAVTSVDNWLRTPFIASHQANRLYVHIEFSMRKCTKYPNPGRLQQCKVEITHTHTHTHTYSRLCTPVYCCFSANFFAVGCSTVILCGIPTCSVPHTGNVVTCHLMYGTDVTVRVGILHRPSLVLPRTVYLYQST